MGKNNGGTGSMGWWEASGCPHIFRALPISLQPSKLLIAFVAIFLTFAIGYFFDYIWIKAGAGVQPTAIIQFALTGTDDPAQAPPLKGLAPELGSNPLADADLAVAGESAPKPAETPSDSPPAESTEIESPAGNTGIFEVFWQHEYRSVEQFLASVIPFSSNVVVQPRGGMVFYSQAGPLHHLHSMWVGVWWMLRAHFLYFLLFGIATLLLWSWSGGIICRMAAIQFARDRKISVREADDFTRERLLGGFFLAPLIPLGVIVAIMFLLAVSGLILAIPVLGDVLAGVGFIICIFGGFAAAIFTIGLIAGLPFFWPGVAVEGQDGFDSFPRAISYSLSKPWKTLLYGVIAVLVIGICWWFAKILTTLAIGITRAAVGFGTSPWGMFDREDGASKLDMIWPDAGGVGLLTSADYSALSWNECISAWLIGLFLLVVLGLLWSFLTSMFFTNGTVVYFLLRREVDGTGLEEVAYDDDGDSCDDEALDVCSPAPSPCCETAASVEAGSTEQEPSEKLADSAGPEADESNDGGDDNQPENEKDSGE